MGIIEYSLEASVLIAYWIYMKNPSSLYNFIMFAYSLTFRWAKKYVKKDIIKMYFYHYLKYITLNDLLHPDTLTAI